MTIPSLPAPQDPVLLDEAFAFHATSLRAAPSIFLQGLPADAHWARADVAAYHARLLEDAGHRPILLALPLSVLATFGPGPDVHALNHPPLEVIHRDVDALALMWGRTDGGWHDSLEVIGSFRTAQPLPAGLLRAHCPKLSEWMARARVAKRRHRQPKGKKR